MYKLAKMCCCLLVVALTGCSWIRTPSWMPFLGNKEQPIVILEEEPVGQSALRIDAGRMIQPERLAEGGKILLVPFRAGPEVVASKELDKIANRIMQGLSIPLKEDKPFFEVHVTDKEVYPEFMIDGYFTTKKENSKFSKFLFRKNKYTVGVEGKLMDAVTREVIATFSHRMETTKPNEDFMTLGFNLGNEIGDFITSNINPESYFS